MNICIAGCPVSQQENSVLQQFYVGITPELAVGIPAYLEKEGKEIVRTEHVTTCCGANALGMISESLTEERKYRRTALRIRRQESSFRLCRQH